MRHDRIDLDRTHPLADRPLHAQKADAVLIFHQLADRAHPAIAEMVDVVDLAAPVLQLDQHLEDRQDVGLAQRAHSVGGVEPQPRVHLDPADRGQIIALAVEKQAVEQRLRRLQGRRLAGPHDPVDVDQRVLAGRVLVDCQSVADIGADRDVIDVEHRQLFDADFDQQGEGGGGDLVSGFEIDLAGRLVDDIRGEIAADQFLVADEDVGEPGLAQPAGGARRDPLARRQHHLAGARIAQVAGQLALEVIGIERRHPALWAVMKGDRPVEPRKDLFLGHAAGFARLQRLAVGLALRPHRFGRGIVERHQQGCGRQFAAPVDADIDVVLGVELEIEPRAAVRDDPRCEQVFARGMGLALVVVEEHAGAAVHLRDDDPFGAVDDEGAVFGHQRHIAHIDVLLLDVADRAGAGILVDVPDDEPQGDFQRCGKGDTALLAFIHIVLRRFELVADEFELCALRKVADRKDRPEHFLQADTGALFRRLAHLQKMVVGTLLHLDQVRHRRDLGDASEALADALLSREGYSHACSSLWAAAGGPDLGFPAGRQDRRPTGSPHCRFAR